MRSCERPLKRSARDAGPSSVSKLYSFSIRTQGSSCRCRASSSPRRVNSFSAASSSRRAASHSSRVPILWSIIFLLLLASYALAWAGSAVRSHIGGVRLGSDEEGDHGHPDDVHDTQRYEQQHQSDARANAVEPELEPRVQTLTAVLAEMPLERRDLVDPRRNREAARGNGAAGPVHRIHGDAD